LHWELLTGVFFLVDTDHHDDEQEERHHRAGVDDHLHGSHQMGEVHDVEDGEGEQSHHQTHGPVDRVSGEYDG
jgi:hypothetical protein